jgi:hypothetical protein
MLRCISGDTPDSEGRYLHSTCRQGEGFTFGGRDAEMGWRIQRIGPAKFNPVTHAIARQRGKSKEFHADPVDYELHTVPLTRPAYTVEQVLSAVLPRPIKDGEFKHYRHI